MNHFYFMTFSLIIKRLNIAIIEVNWLRYLEPPFCCHTIYAEREKERKRLRERTNCVRVCVFVNVHEDNKSMFFSFCFLFPFFVSFRFFCFSTFFFASFLSFSHTKYKPEAANVLHVLKVFACGVLIKSILLKLLLSLHFLLPFCCSFIRSFFLSLLIMYKFFFLFWFASSIEHAIVKQRRKKKNPKNGWNI